MQHVVAARQRQRRLRQRRRSLVRLCNRPQSAASACVSRVRLPCRRFHAHPGELAAAERWAATAQRRLAGAAAAAAGGGRGPRVAVSVHTDVTMFILSQPALLQGDGAQPSAQGERDRSRQCRSSVILHPMPGCLCTGARGARPAACQTQLPPDARIELSLTMHYGSINEAWSGQARRPQAPHKALAARRRPGGARALLPAPAQPGAFRAPHPRRAALPAQAEVW